VRDINKSLAPDRGLRVLAGDPPIDWSRVASFEDWARAKRDPHAAAVIEREVLAKRRKALVVYGAMHVERGTGMLVDLLEQKGQRVFTIQVTEEPGPRWIGEHCEARAERTSCDGPEERGELDARLALGPATFSEPRPEVVADDAYHAELVRRSRVLNGIAREQLEALRHASTSR
jgi:hypothetical protein